MLAPNGNRLLCSTLTHQPPCKHPRVTMLARVIEVRASTNLESFCPNHRHHWGLTSNHQMPEIYFF